MSELVDPTLASELAKVKGLATAGLERYREAVRSCLR